MRAKLTHKRREQILASLNAGNLIYRHWSGGKLSHRLEGVGNLREAEVTALWYEKLLEVVPRVDGVIPQFRPFKIKHSEKKEAVG